MDKKELERRTRQFALRVVSLVSTLPSGKVPDVLGRQLLRSGTSVGANYREANRGSSRADFLHKINLVEREAAEALYWLELMEGAGLGRPEELSSLHEECDQLVAIFTRIGRSTKSNPKPEIRNPKS